MHELLRRDLQEVAWPGGLVQQIPMLLEISLPDLYAYQNDFIMCVVEKAKI